MLQEPNSVVTFWKFIAAGTNFLALIAVRPRQRQRKCSASHPPK
ncbi:hypothetical protein ES319_A08G116300v1 [Gossypium barbadense]|uniref:Uncharacterized protein n=3 Tax=Gossypium TaxID=3633 RepID=A0A5J5UQT0_GOSBA|nr:hypothetical protein ES319_A08G116300v1 [Gossypium barbadense]TYH06057.1 hypothetical protein ES288_A08G127700v1 [Gossypium darwinii]TYI14527.1 hypothetical protein ES332_A08G126800v1 [Gossypium tomentosum]